MKVQLVAESTIDDTALMMLGYNTHTTDHAADELAEFAGRACYQSFNRPNPATATNETYLEHILDVGHESVLEHGSATFYIEASRSVLTELERHRHLSFSVLSQRYVDPVPFGVQIPPAIDKLPEAQRQEAYAILVGHQEQSAVAYDRLLNVFESQGLPRKQAREAARAVLPNMQNSPMVVTGNHRAWRYVIKARWHEAADADIRELAGELLTQLREIAPNTYQDIPFTPYSYGS
ncbi:thymidylate synthase [Mycobacterium phage Catalina]|uniref:ThyX-like thymidylate synthase n=1 Tax=Mycobacterium phage Catalina TaxID=1792253 RepID=A0A127KPD8_9CAUD|nr:thymidylate synthase [Mycobacterium phage Catalina]AMO43817.1 ThyX-like thymidylate synthase [Mycobacterium phage Catalina]